MFKKQIRKGFEMKTLLIAILILITSTMNLSARTTNIYQHAREMRISTLNQQNVKNSSKKLFFATRAAKRGNVKAQFDLAMMYASGDGVAKNEKIAFKWFHKSAKNGHVEAKYYMGLSFLQGRGVKKQLHLARHWFKLAAKAGHPKAIYHLSRIEKALFPNERGTNHYSMR
jgi:TPR repeat protein